jgi:hypothetical protein
MARHVFYALHYDEDRTRAAGILGSTTLDANLEASHAEWAKLQRSGDFAIQRWIEGQLKGRSCTIVLIGAHTNLRPWVQYEIRRSRQLKLALIGVRIHQLTDAQGHAADKGESPFEHPKCELGSGAGAIPVYDSPGGDSRLVQKYILENITRWADDAAAERRPWQ